MDTNAAKGGLKALALEEAFLRDIIDHPLDDTPRYVYADWLEENGEEWKALSIRRGLRQQGANGAARERGARYSEEQKSYTSNIPDAGQEWRHFARGMERSHRNASRSSFWTGSVGSKWADWALARIPKVVGTIAYVRRGFVFEVYVEPKVWIDHGPAIVRSNPIERVRLRGVFPHKVNRKALGYVGWVCRWFVDESLSVPTPIFSYLPCNTWDNSHYRGFSSTEEGAYTYLSDACIAWAKRQIVTAHGNVPPLIKNTRIGRLDG